MLHNRLRSTMVFLLLTIQRFGNVDIGNCNTAIYSKNYTETNPNLLIVNFATMITQEDNILEMLHLRSAPFENFTVNHLIFLYPYGNCHINIMEAFTDVLLN